MKQPVSESDIVECLNRLYQLFQEEYVENKQVGQVSSVSHSHLVCNGSKKERIVSLSELYALENEENKQDIQEIRTFTTLLPSHATFYILHYPRIHDIFVISWKEMKI
jgi:hypothetical protein